MRSLLNRPFWAKLLAIVTIGVAAVVFAESGTHYTMTITPMWKLNNETDYPPFVNQPPQVNAGADQTIILPSAANLNGMVTDDGLPNPPAAVTSIWTKVSGPGAVTFSDVTARTTTATFAVAGIYVLKLTASDSALSASDDVQITVSSAGVVNQAPQVNAGANQTITLPAVANLTGTVTDDGLPNPPAAVTQSWAKVSGPGTVTFGNVNARTTTATFAVAGIYVLKLTASDSVLSASDEVQITVDSQVVDLPQARIEFVSDQSLMFSNPGQFRTVTVRVLDENGVVVPNAQVTWVSTTPASVAVAATGPLSAKVTAQANWSSGTVPINVAYAALDLTAKALATMGTPAPETVLLSSDDVLDITGDRFAEHQVTLERTPETEVLQVGDIIVTGEKAGVMVRILQVTVQANQLVLRVEPVAINVAFKDIDSYSVGEPIDLLWQGSEQGSTVTLRSQSGKIITSRKILKDFKNSPFGFECTGNVTPISLNVSALSLETSLIPRTGYKVDRGTLVDFFVIFEGGAVVKFGNLTLSGDISGKCQSFIEVTFSSLLGTSPFSIAATSKFSLGVEANVSASGTVFKTPMLEHKESFRAGIRYTDDGHLKEWKLIKDPTDPPSPKTDSGSITNPAQIQIKVGPYYEFSEDVELVLGLKKLGGPTLLKLYDVLKLKAGSYVEFTQLTPFDKTLATYSGPLAKMGLEAKASVTLQAGLFGVNNEDDGVSDYLEINLTTPPLSADIVSLNHVFLASLRPTGDISCIPNCNSLTANGNSSVTLKGQADTTDIGTMEFWVSKNGDINLTQLTATAFSGGIGQTVFSGPFEPGNYDVYPRLKIDKWSWIHNLLPLALENGASIGSFTVDKRLAMVPPSVSLSGKGGESGSQDMALIIYNSQDTVANYTLQWNPQTQNVNLSPMSGTIQFQDNIHITANYTCPVAGGNWDGKIELHNSDGGVEDGANISLSCTCELTCCDPSGCPQPEPGPTGGGSGDPHLSTFDRLAYDFQGVGEFIFAKSLLPNDTFEVQVRTKPWGERTDVALIQAAAMKVVNDRVSFYNGLDPIAHINGVPKAFTENETVTLPTGGNVNYKNGLYRVSWPDRSYVNFQKWNTTVTVAESKNNHLIGLLGNSDSDTQNDVAMRNGASLGTTMNFTTFYPNYVNSWRITQQESLFDYAAGETTETFTDRNFPRTSADADNLPAAAHASAEQICRAAGITDPVLLKNCILDVALTGDPNFAQDGANLLPPQATVEITPPPPHTINDPGFGQFKGSVTDAVTNLLMNTGTADLTVDGTPLTGITTKPITNGIYETDVVPIGNGYLLDIQANGYINEKVFALTALDRQLVQVEPVKLVPSTANGTGTITGHIANALNNNNVANANILARRYINQRAGDSIGNAVTNTEGNFTLNGLTAGNYTLEVNGTGFIANYLIAVVLGNQTTNVTATISPELGASQFRIVLTWGENPSDLDSHLTGPDDTGERFHISYEDRGNSDLTVAPYAYLDRDDRSSFGPETITIGQLIPGDVYRYSVNHYSGSSTLALSGAKVEVYGNNNRLLTTLNVPNQEGTLWTVFEINPAGVIVPVNQITNGTNPYSAPAGQRTGNQQDLVTDYWQMLFQKKD